MEIEALKSLAEIVTAILISEGRIYKEYLRVRGTTQVHARAFWTPPVRIPGRGSI